ncbi:MAG: sigma-70 family RNA polymerase sigma factor [Victivallales bacterium]|nr:sigma-70 family RNA polymerase sigma factor [Victivallales bacterium]
MIYTTRKTLLEAIKDGEEISWHEFYATYRPLIILRGSDFQLTADEKEELVQLVLLEIFHKRKSFQYDRNRGRLRDYLRKIIGGKAVDILRKRKNNHVSADVLDYWPDKDSLLEQSWEKEWQGHLWTQALEILRNRLKPVTFQAFELHVINEKPAEKVALFLNISVNMVYVAKSRSVKNLRTIIRELQDII